MKKKGWNKNVWCILFSFFTVVIFGQTRELSLEESIAIALEGNIDIKKGKNNLKEAAHNTFTSYAELFPKVEIFSNAFGSKGNTFDELTGQLRTTSGDFVNVSLTATWDILQVLRKYSTVKYAKNNKTNVSLGLENTKDETVLKVVQAYLETLQSIDQGVILQEFINTQSENLEQVNEMVKLGRMAGQDYLFQRAELSSLSSALVENENIINQRKNRLRLLLGIDMSIPLELKKVILPEDQLRLYSKASIDSLYEEAIDKRNDVNSRKYEVASLKSQLHLKRADYYPNINLFYRYGSGYSSFQELSFQDQFFTNNKFEAYGVEVVIPVLNGNKFRNETYKSKIAYENSKLDLKQYKNTVYSQISDGQYTVAKGIEEVVHRKDRLVFTKQNYDMSREKYFLQASSSQELSIAYRDFIEAELLLSQASYELHYSIYEMNYYIGNL
ncbi:TolC family protein [Ascidiimonas sp. W6]|uniref:TolC family protein n=1 Tax=Ascidiimonas meishanensis TaxID=3128903 RepID=UPI0030EF525F